MPTRSVCFLFLIPLLLAGCSGSGRIEDDKKAEAEDTTEKVLTEGERVHNQIQRKIRARLRSSTHPVFSRHLQSVADVVAVEWVKTRMIARKDIKNARKFVTYGQKIVEGLEGASGLWETYQRGEKSLVRSFVSRYDRYGTRRGWGGSSRKSQQTSAANPRAQSQG